MAVILAVEQDPMIRGARARLLERAGHQVVQAQTIEGALSRLATQSTDLVLTSLDEDVARNTGLHLAQELPRGTDRPLILLLIFSEQQKVADDGKDAGLFDGWIVRRDVRKTLADKIADMLQVSSRAAGT